MLVIVNPYATTMSDRLKHLVVYALQGRYDVHAVDTQRRGHATELCREAAQRGLRRGRRLRRRRHRQRGRQRAGRLRDAADLPARRLEQRLREDARDPRDVVDATEHLLEHRRRLGAAPVDLGVVNGRCFTFAAGHGARRERGRARRRATRA